MFEGVTFGRRIAALTVATVQLLAVAMGLTRVFANRAANRTLATRLIVFAGILLPSLIDFAVLRRAWRGEPR